MPRQISLVSIKPLQSWPRSGRNKSKGLGCRSTSALNQQAPTLVISKMEEQYISNPRPLWRADETKETRGRRTMTIGGTTAGIVVRVTKKGVEFNGYYAGFSSGSKYATMREFVFMSWDDFDKMRESVFLRKPVKKEVVMRDPDAIDEKPDKKYLDSLIKVTLNGKKYYVDMDRKERRPVENPEQVFNFENQAAKETK